MTEDFSMLKLDSNQGSLHEGRKPLDGNSKTINGFSKLASENWMEDKNQELCKKYNAAFGAILNEDVLQLITIGVEEIPTDRPTVFLINNKMHYSIFIKNKEGAFRYNSLQLELNELENVFLKEKLQMELTAKNKLTPQTDGWSCGFHALYALELFLQYNSLDLIDKKPLLVTQLNEMLSNYVSDLEAVQEEIWSDYTVFYKMFIDNKPVDELSCYFKSFCESLRNIDLEKKCKVEEMQSEKKFFKDRINKVKQIECLLVGLWKLEKEQHGAFLNFMKLVSLNIEERKALYRLLEQRSWTREALVKKFLETYLLVKGERLLPHSGNF
ncbi:hypothetical protein [Neochlamydia sp. AcF95]|uniref:hypothetical protein n=1 Tax=Neochlamydia sp. AcF95 TaxID=2795734 RepID=UPI001BC9E656|nr:hypothetical protein [Neochlamydia sp. AcF95]MBS4169958.1 hypothetical protein [Neochlamydia sp. AcF95]